MLPEEGGIAAHAAVYPWFRVIQIDSTEWLLK